MWLYTEVPRSLQQFTSMPSIHQKVPRKNSIHAIGSSGMGRRRLQPNSIGRRRGGLGERWGRSCGSPTTRLWPKKEAGRLRRAWTAAQAGSVRCGFQTGKLRGNARRLVPREDVLACGEGLGVVGQIGKPVERRAQRGAALAAVAVLGSELGHTRGVARPFIGNRPLSRGVPAPRGSGRGQQRCTAARAALAGQAGSDPARTASRHMVSASLKMTRCVHGLRAHDLGNARRFGKARTWTPRVAGHHAAWRTRSGAPGILAGVTSWRDADPISISPS
jgi:hypothetical protein